MDNGRENILFYRSFYEAIKAMPDEHTQVELYNTVFDYWFYGKEPDIENISPIAKGMFALMRPVINTNRTLAENGKKGGRKGKSKKESYNLSFSQEVEIMKADQPFCDSVCEEFSLSAEEFASQLNAFLEFCNNYRPSKPHDSLDDARSHFRLWIRKIKANQSSEPLPESDDAPTDYTYTGGFGGLDV